MRIHPLLVLLSTLTTACANDAGNGGGDSGDAFKPANADLHTRLADHAYARGDLLPARANAREALRIDPRRGDAAKILARAEVLLGSKEAALAAARRATALAQDDADAWLLLYDCAEEAGEFEEANSALERSVALGSADAGLASAGRALAAGDEAPIRDLLASEPRSHAALGLYADRLAATGRGTEAIALLDAALGKTPNDSALALTRQRISIDNAVIAPPRELRESNSPESMLLDAAMLLKRGEASKAAAAYREIVRAEPTHVVPRICLGEALLAMNDHLGAVAAFESALEIDSHDLDALLGIARAHLVRGAYEDALTTLDRANLVAPDRLAVHGLLVAAAHGAGDVKRATAEAIAVRRIDPGGAIDLRCREILATKAERPK